jgi:hypothetical protein
MVDFAGKDLELCRKAAEMIADIIVAEINKNGKNTDEDNFEYQGTRTSYPLVIPQVENPTISGYVKEEIEKEIEDEENN